MDRIKGWWKRLRALLRRSAVEREKEDVRDARSFRWIEHLGQDLRYALRTLLRNPGFTAAAVLTLALGIGATTAIFSVVHAVLLRPLSIKDQNRVVVLGKTFPEQGFDRVPVSLRELRAWREGTEAFEALAAMHAYNSYFAWIWRIEGEEPVRIPSAAVGHDLFPVLGVGPMLGRGFRPEDDQENAALVALVSHRFWRQRLGGDPGALGRSLTLYPDRSFTIVGIMPPGFHYPGGTDIWIPLLPERGWSDDTALLSVVGRLRPGASLESARAELQVVADRFAAERARMTQGQRAVVQPVLETIVGDVRTALWILLGAVALVLAIAAANVAGLLLVRATTRGREFAVRAALGAARSRIVRQLLTESAVLGLLGAALGVALATVGIGPLLALAPAALPRAEAIGMDGTVLGFALLVSLTSALAFGLAPALQARKPDLTAAMNVGGRSTGGVRRYRLNRAFVVGELALALVLLAGAGLLMRSFVRQLRIERGFGAEQLLSAAVLLPRSKYPEPDQRRAFFQRLIARVEGLPGVVGATATLNRPLISDGYSLRFQLEGQSPQDAAARNPWLNYEAASPDYFRVLGIPLVRGRTFGPQDGAEGAPGVAIINQTMANRYWPGQDPIGKRVRLTGIDDGWLTVVGVVGDVKYREVTTGGLDIYVPLRRGLHPPNYLMVRTASDPAGMIPAIRREIRALDGDVPVDDIETVRRSLSQALAGPRFSLVLLGLFAAVALGLAAIGIYGVVAAFVGQRTHELGIRMALGADRSDIRRLVLREAVILVTAGLALGTAIAVAATRLLQGLLYDTSPVDPATFAAVAAILGAAALLASWLPARRAARTDPMIALRVE